MLVTINTKEGFKPIRDQQGTNGHRPSCPQIKSFTFNLNPEHNAGTSEEPSADIKTRLKRRLTNALKFFDQRNTKDLRRLQTKRLLALSVALFSTFVWFMTSRPQSPAGLPISQCFYSLIRPRYQGGCDGR